MKRILLILVVLSILMTAFIPNTVAYAASVPTITVGGVSGKAGDIVEVPVVMENNPGIIAILFSIEYDETKLSLQSVEDGGLLGTGHATFGKDLSANPYSMLWEDSVASDNHCDDGTIVTLTFKVLETAQAGKTEIKLNLDQGSTFNYDMDEVVFDICNGTITIEGDEDEPEINYTDPTIAVGNASASAGDLITLPITVYNNPGIIAILFSIEYDETKLSLQSVEDGGLLGTGHATFGKDLSANPYSMLWEDSVAADNYYDDGTIVTLTFKVLETAQAGKTEIKLNLDYGSTFNYDMDDVAFEVCNGTVTIDGDIPDVEEPDENYTDPTIAVGKTSAKSGDLISVPVTVYNNPGIIAILFSIEYDETKLSLQSVEDGGLLGTGHATFGKDLSANPYSMLWEASVATENYCNDGVIVTLTFKVLETALAGYTEIKLNLDQGSTFNYDMEDVVFDICNGTITIEDDEDEPEVNYTDPTIAVGNVSASAGDLITLPITVYNNPGIIALKLSIEYDSNCLKLIDVSDGEIFSDGVALFGNDLSVVPFNLLWEDGLATKNYTNNGVVAYLTFKVVKEINVETQISIILDQKSTFDLNLNDVYFDTVSGSISNNIYIESKHNSTTIIDRSGGFIYGLTGSLSMEIFEENYIDVVGDAYLEYVLGIGFGTDTEVNLYSKITNEMILSYTIVIFGDVNGDGWYDGMDAVIVSCLANGMLTKDDVSEAVYMAADCNHDGVINQLDVDLLNQAGTLLANVDQSKPVDVLLETSSEYIEYLDLIDQSPEIEVEDDTETDVEPSVPESDDTEEDTEDSTQQGSAEISFIDMIINFIKSIFEMLFAYIPVPIK